MTQSQTIKRHNLNLKPAICNGMPFLIRRDTQICWSEKTIFHQNIFSFLHAQNQSNKTVSTWYDRHKRFHHAHRLITCWRTLAFLTGWWSGIRPKWMCGKWAHWQVLKTKIGSVKRKPRHRHSVVCRIKTEKLNWNPNKFISFSLKYKKKNPN